MSLDTISFFFIQPKMKKSLANTIENKLVNNKDILRYVCSYLIDQRDKLKIRLLSKFHKKSFDSFVPVNLYCIPQSRCTFTLRTLHISNHTSLRDWVRFAEGHPPIRIIMRACDLDTWENFKEWSEKIQIKSVLELTLIMQPRNIPRIHKYVAAFFPSLKRLDMIVDNDRPAMIGFDILDYEKLAPLQHLNTLKIEGNHNIPDIGLAEMGFAPLSKLKLCCTSAQISCLLKNLQGSNVTSLSLSMRKGICDDPLKITIDDNSKIKRLKVINSFDRRLESIEIEFAKDMEYLKVRTGFSFNLKTNHRIRHIELHSIGFLYLSGIGKVDDMIRYYNKRPIIQLENPMAIAKYTLIEIGVPFDLRYSNLKYTNYVTVDDLVGTEETLIVPFGDSIYGTEPWEYRIVKCANDLSIDCEYTSHKCISHTHIEAISCGLEWHICKSKRTNVYAMIGGKKEQLYPIFEQIRIDNNPFGLLSPRERDSERVSVVKKQRLY
jgi:hypothetical protein